MILFPNCKLNLGLHILARRNDGYHDIETVFYPLPFHDALEVVMQPGSQEIQFSMSGTPLKIDEATNLCVRAYWLLARELPQVPAVKMHLHKCVPTGAGLGGGSADGAFALRLLNTQLGLGASDEQLSALALELGSDCPFFINNTPALGTLRGECLTPIPLDLSRFAVVLIHPGIHVDTAWAFSQITPSNTRLPLSEIISGPVEDWKHNLVNDFEEPVFRHHPRIRGLKDDFYKKGAVYAAMTGSGSAVYALFPRGDVPEFPTPPGYVVQKISLPAEAVHPDLKIL